MSKRIHLCLAHLSGHEQRFVQEAFDTNWVVPLGPNVTAFEEDVRAFMGNDKEVVALNSGTAAVHLGLLALGVRQGDEVICQDFTFCASVNPVRYLGGVPVLVDSETETWNIDPDLLDLAIRDRMDKTGRKPKAVVTVCMYGMPPKMDRIMEVAGRYGIPVLEDSAEAMGSRFKGRLCGTFGRFGVLSFNGNKMITTSGGGALICPDGEAKDMTTYYATQSRKPLPYYQHEETGFNYRLSNVCAGIGRGQMLVLEEHIAHHRHVQALYEELLKEVKGLDVHVQPDKDFDSNYWLCTVLLDGNLAVKGQGKAYEATVRTDCEPDANVEAMRLFLDAKGIESRPLWKPMHKQPLFADCPAYLNGVSEDLFHRGLCLPSGPCVSDDDVRYIVECIKESVG